MDSDCRTRTGPTDCLRRPAATWHRNDAERRRDRCEMRGCRAGALSGGIACRCGGASACSSRGASTRSQPVSAERVLKMLRAAGSSFAVRASQFGRGRLLEVISSQPAVERVLKLPPSDGLLTECFAVVPLQSHTSPLRARSLRSFRAARPFRAARRPERPGSGAKRSRYGA